MIHTLWHNFRPWKVWAGGIILIGLLLIATQCTPTATSIVQETPTREPPEITGFTCIPPDTVLPGAKIGIHVKVKLHGHKIDNYRWVVEEGSIVSGQGESAITYQAPETPGSYKVCVKLECEGSSVEYSEMVEVVPKPTPTEEPTVEPTEQPTEEPTEEPTAEPTEQPTEEPTEEPTAEPTEQPTEEPTEEPTAEPTVEPTEEPTPKPDDAVVKVEALNLRSGPGTAYYSIRVLKQSSTLKVTGKNLDGDWLKVIAPGGEEGWVAASCLEINVPLAGLAVAQAPPAPTPIPAPAPIATPTPTETPAPLPAPQLLEPKDAARFVGVVHLTWEWKVRPLAEDEYFSVRIRPERARSEDPIPTPCWHSAVKDFHYHGNISDYCTNNKHYWSVIVAREAPESPTGWEEISVISEERWFDFFECFEEEDPGVCPRC